MNWPSRQPCTFYAYIIELAHLCRMLSCKQVYMALLALVAQYCESPSVITVG